MNEALGKPTFSAGPDLRSLLADGARTLSDDGDLRASRALFDAAYWTAERIGDPIAMAYAALGLGGLWVHEHRTTAAAVAVRECQRRALAYVDPQSSVGLRLRIRIAAEDDYLSGGSSSILAMLDEATSATDSLARAEALSLAHHCLLGADQTALRRALADELVAESARTRRRSDLLMGLLWQTVDQFLAADRHAEMRDGATIARCELTTAARDVAGLVIRASEAGPHGTTVVCRRRGRLWQVTWGRRTALVEHLVGMQYLAALVANPGREIAAVELAAGPGHGEAHAAALPQPVLDEVARRRYRERLAELTAEIDELESANDLERAAKARGERDWLIEELAAATGMAGRSRHFAGNAERARIAVGKAIRRAIDRIANADPAIGAELKATVRTGGRCSYQPRGLG